MQGKGEARIMYQLHVVSENNYSCPLYCQLRNKRAGYQIKDKHIHSLGLHINQSDFSNKQEDILTVLIKD
jgi:hypothetical protein